MRRFFTENLTLKIISLVLAIALWLYVVGEETAEIGLSIPLEIINVPPGLTVTNDVIEDINVRVSGPRRLIRRLASENLGKSIDLKGVEPGMISFEILPEELPLPHGVKVIRLSPSSITLKVEKIEEKKVNILPVLQGSPRYGYEVVSVRFIPDKVTVSGPASVLASLDALWTKPINVEKKSKSFKQQAVLDLSLHQVTILNKEPVEVEVTIDRKIITRTFKDVPIKIINAAYSYRLKPRQVHLKLMGPLNVVAKMDKQKDLEVYIDLEGLPPGEYLRKPSLHIPSGLTILDIVPSFVEVKILNKKKGE